MSVLNVSTFQPEWSRRKEEWERLDDRVIQNERERAEGPEQKDQNENRRTREVLLPDAPPAQFEFFSCAVGRVFFVRILLYECAPCAVRHPPLLGIWAVTHTHENVERLKWAKVRRRWGAAVLLIM